MNITSLWKGIDRNLPVIAGLVLAITVSLWGYGCASKTASPVSGSSVTREQLAAEAEAWTAETNAAVEMKAASLWQEVSKLQTDITNLTTHAEAQAVALQAKINAAVADLDGQDEMRQWILSTAAQGLQSIGGPVPAALGAILLSGGAILNGRRKDHVIAVVKAERDAARASAVKPS